MKVLCGVCSVKTGADADRWRRQSRLIEASLSTLLVLLLSAFANAKDANYTVEVCPDAQWKDAIFLKGPSSNETFGNVTKWKKQQVQDYVTGTVLPQARPNLAFVALAVVTLLVFLLWRLFRRCCICCCMRQSCEEQRGKADPRKVLSGCGYWLQKIILLVFALAALAILLAGIIMAPKSLFVKLWTPVNRMTDHLNNVTVSMDNLVKGLSDVNPILDNLVGIVNDINLTDVRSKLKSVGSTLDSSDTNPDNLVNNLAAVNTNLTSVRSQVALLRPQLGSQGLPANLSTLQAGLPGLSSVISTCQDYSTQLGNLNTELQTLNGEAGPVYVTSSLETALAAVDVTTWSAALSSMLGTLDVWRSFQMGNTLGKLASTLSDLSSAVNTLKNPQIPSTATSLQSFYDAWNGVNANLKALLDRITYIQTNVAQLDATSNAAVAKLNKVYSNISSFTSLQPSPTSLAANLSALSAELSLGPTAQLVSDLNDAQAAINAVPLATLDDARSSLGNLRSALDSLSPKLTSTSASISAYNSNANQATFDAMKSSAVATGNTWDLSQAAKAKADTAASSTSVLAVQTAAQGNVGSLASNINTRAPLVDSAVAAMDTAIAGRPSLDPYLSLTASVKSVYASMPSPRSKELDSISSTLSTVENLLVSVPASVRSQTSSVQASFGSGVDQLRTKVIVKAHDFERNRNGTVEMVDLARYRATCVLLAIAAFAVVLLILFALINCPWGIGCAIFFLLALAALLFVLAVLFASVLVVAQDGCYHTENIVLKALGNGSTVTPLANYYFFGSDTTSIKSVLKSSNLVDINKVQQDVVGLADGMIANFTLKYNPRPRLTDVITKTRTFINTTLTRIDSLLDMANVTNVRPLYTAIKSYPCCEMTDYSFKLWVVLTFGGWLMYMSAGLAMTFLGRLDKLPQSGCCGCKPLVGKALTSKVHPEMEGGEDGAAKAVVIPPSEQTMKEQQQQQQQPRPGEMPPSQPYGNGMAYTTPAPYYYPPPPQPGFYGQQPYGPAAGPSPPGA